MSADGTWHITLSTPMGPQSVTAAIWTQGDTFTADVDSPMGSKTVSGTVSGDVLQWSVTVTKPMTLDIEFTMTVAGDSMTGTARLGLFGNAPVIGERI